MHEYFTYKLFLIVQLLLYYILDLPPEFTMTYSLSSSTLSLASFFCFGTVVAVTVEVLVTSNFPNVNSAYGLMISESRSDSICSCTLLGGGGAGRMGLFTGLQNSLLFRRVLAGLLGIFVGCFEVDVTVALGKGRAGRTGFEFFPLLRPTFLGEDFSLSGLTEDSCVEDGPWLNSAAGCFLLELGDTIFGVLGAPKSISESNQLFSGAELEIGTLCTESACRLTEERFKCVENCLTREPIVPREDFLVGDSCSLGTLFVSLH